MREVVSICLVRRKKVHQTHTNSRPHFVFSIFERKQGDDDDDEEEEADLVDVLPEEVRQYVDSKQPFEKRLEAAVNIVKRAYSEVPSYDAVIDAALRVPLEQLHSECTLQPGVPVAPMLAKPTKSIQEVLKRLNGLEFTCEYKYDGERAQIHQLPSGTTNVFSRNLLDTSEKYPEVPLFVKEAAVAAGKQVDSFVMDAEVVAWRFLYVVVGVSCGWNVTVLALLVQLETGKRPILDDPS